MSNSYAKLMKIKGLMLSASENLAENNRDVASQLMEIALDEMQGVSSEDIEVGFEVVADNTEPLTDEFTENDEYDVDMGDVEPVEGSHIEEEACDTTAHNKLYNIVESMIGSAR